MLPHDFHLFDGSCGSGWSKVVCASYGTKKQSHPNYIPTISQLGAS
uniref:Uncharacterized protein n=1 Tax=Anguilla anguilla TaxID=7936 RepID=A0A0E9SVJ1_ANGAN